MGVEILKTCAERTAEYKRKNERFITFVIERRKTAKSNSFEFCFLEKIKEVLNDEGDSVAWKLGLWAHRGRHDW